MASEDWQPLLKGSVNAIDKSMPNIRLYFKETVEVYVNFPHYPQILSSGTLRQNTSVFRAIAERAIAERKAGVKAKPKALTLPPTKPSPSLPTPRDQRKQRADMEQQKKWRDEDHAAVMSLIKNGPDAQFARLAEAHDKARARGVLDSYQHTAAAIAAAAAKARAGKADVPAVRDPLAKKIMAAASKAKTKTSHDGPPKDSLAEKIVNAGKNARRPFGE